MAAPGSAVPVPVPPSASSSSGDAPARAAPRPPAGLDERSTALELALYGMRDTCNALFYSTTLKIDERISALSGRVEKVEEGWKALRDFVRVKVVDPPLDPVEILPPTVVDYIFSYFDQNALVAASSVSRRWAEVVRQGDLIAALPHAFVLSPFAGKALVESFVKARPGVTRLDLRACSRLLTRHFVDLAEAGTLAHITELNVSLRHASTERIVQQDDPSSLDDGSGLEAFVALANPSNLPALATLRVEATFPVTVPCGAVAKFLAGGQRVALAMTGMFGFAAEDKDSTEVVSTSASMREIVVDTLPGMSNDGCAPFWMRVLDGLEAAGAPIEVLGLIGFARSCDGVYAAVARFPSLRKIRLDPGLELSEDGRGGDAVAAVCALPGLEKLELVRPGGLVAGDSTESGPLRIHRLFENMPESWNLRKVTLEWLPSLDDACLEMLVAKQPGLTKLSLAGVGVTHLAPVAALAPTLTDLSVVHVMVDDAAAAVRPLTNLTKLQLAWMRVNTAQVAEIAKGPSKLRELRLVATPASDYSPLLAANPNLARLEIKVPTHPVKIQSFPTMRHLRHVKIDSCAKGSSLFLAERFPNAVTVDFGLTLTSYSAEYIPNFTRLRSITVDDFTLPHLVTELATGMSSLHTVTARGRNAKFARKWTRSLCRRRYDSGAGA